MVVQLQDSLSRGQNLAVDQGLEFFDTAQLPLAISNSFHANWWPLLRLLKRFPNHFEKPSVKFFKGHSKRPKVKVQSNFDLVTVNLVTILDLVTFFRKTNFLCSKKVDLVTFWKILEP